MVLLVLGTFAPAGSLLQKMLFLLPAPVLGYTAYVAGQRMFTALQAVVTVGATARAVAMLPANISTRPVNVSTPLNTARPDRPDSSAPPRAAVANMACVEGVNSKSLSTLRDCIDDSRWLLTVERPHVPSLAGGTERCCQ